MQRSLTIAISAIVLGVSAGFVGMHIWQNWAELRAYELPVTGWVTTAIAIPVLATACLLLSSAWHGWMRLHEAGTDAATDRVIYARSQLAKYVPGNVLHLAGRHWLGRQAGVEDGPLVAAAALELLGLVVAAGLLSALMLLTADTLPAASGLYEFGFGQRTLAGFVIAIAALAAAAIVSQSRKRFARWTQRLREHPRQLATIFIQYLAYFAVTGGVFAAIAVSLGAPASLSGIAMLVLVATASWLAGFLTPGAPAGLGVREAVMIALLSDPLSPSMILALAGLFRIATSVGDASFFVVAGYRRRPIAPRP